MLLWADSVVSWKQRMKRGKEAKDGMEEPRMTEWWWWWEGDLFPACISLNGKRWNAHTGSPSVSREGERARDREAERESRERRER